MTLGFQAEVKVPVWTLGDRLRKARESAGYNQKQLAELLQLSAKTMNNWEADRIVPKRGHIAAWSMATGAPMVWLETGEAPSPDGDGASHVVRPKGLEPLTSWYVVSGDSYAGSAIKRVA